MTSWNKSVKGNYKQQLVRRQKTPTKEAKERYEDWLWDKDVLRVFVDASELKRQGIFGLGVIFVGQGSTLVKSKKHYKQSMKKMNVYAELVAVEFAMTQLGQVIDNQFSLPSKVYIYSDWSDIKNIKEKTLLDNKIPAINTVSENINEMRNKFLLIHPALELEIFYMGIEEKKYNPFYKGAHNAARMIIGI